MNLSHWWRSVGAAAPRAPLPGDLEVDVCIVGGGLTGLWTAYYLREAAPDLRVAVVEEHHAGFGASGRNGGWLTNEITGGVEQYRRTHGDAAVEAFQAAMNDTVRTVVETAAAEGIDADIHLGGELTVARGTPQLHRLHDLHRSMSSRPGTDVEWLDAEATRARVGVQGASGAIWHPHCARLHPAKLVRGLAEVVAARGAEVYEQTRVLEIRPGRAHTDHGVVSARHVLRATEGFTPRLRGLRRTWLPLNSSMIVTVPLPASAWEEIGWAGRETLGDGAHAYMYAQRTADDRIALGGRGVPYRYASRFDAAGRTPDRTVAQLRRILETFFPVLTGVGIEHSWSGVLGVPRDWHATVGLDERTGLGWAGGYVGTGVTATNLAGRTLRDLVLGRRTELTALPWVNHRVRRWEPEPLRYLGVMGLYRAYSYADRAEQAGRTTTSPVARIADVVSGRGH
ncbi:FAD-dependent oxidoreductase [Nocardioides mangrovicus]|uniref:FAD-dependent oxidoreductase n=1 Tax=Nocardioides mangrovicus TaxID=2478913 RepID=A0A3L8P0G3_9ACTN|nr:FAD-dependent oxidoreductase [Nocardioides mangrovicus]RLV48926.1 FAD-dependent oxidoreductase [Nocardioides mangrovicus]